MPLSPIRSYPLHPYHKKNILFFFVVYEKKHSFFSSYHFLFALHGEMVFNVRYFSLLSGASFQLGLLKSGFILGGIATGLGFAFRRLFHPLHLLNSWLFSSLYNSYRINQNQDSEIPAIGRQEFSITFYLPSMAS